MKNNRKGIPQDLKREVEAGEMKSYFSEQEKILIYRARDYKRPNTNDKKSYLILSTFHSNCRKAIVDKNNQVKNNIVAKGRGKTRVFENLGPMTRPVATEYYNKNKDPVDRSDAKTNKSIFVKGRKWYRRLVDELLFNTAVVNAFELYRSTIQNFDLRTTTIPKECTKLFIKLIQDGKKESK